MDGDYGLDDLRFEGYDNQALAEQVDGLRNGAGSESLHNAARALIALAGGLAETDRVLREQLQQIGVSWQGQAADGGTAATKQASVFAEDAVTPVGESAKGVSNQSGSFAHTRNSAPDSGTLRGPTQLDGFDRFAGLLGHTTDHAKDVASTGAARDQAIAGLNGYQSASSSAIGGVQTLPVPPGVGLVTQQSATGTQVGPVDGFHGGSGFTPGAPGQPPGAPGSAPAPGGSGAAPLLGGQPGGPAPGPGPVGLPGQPGPRTGVGPVLPLPTGLPVEGAPGFGPRAVPSLLVADAAAIAGAGAQGAAVGATTEKDRLVRGRPGAGGAPGGGVAEAEREGRGGAPKSPLAQEPPEEARSVRNAEKFGARSPKPAASSILQPATGNAPDEEDGEHVRKYGVESADVFEDYRPIAPALIGDDDDEG
ncbi:MAG: hypothetical protein ACJ72N_16260 [Labedaea sp.]